MLTEAAGFIVRNFWAAGISSAAQSVVQVIANPSSQSTAGHQSWKEYKWSPRQQPPQVQAPPAYTPPQRPVQQYQSQPPATRQPQATRIDYDTYTL